MIIALAGRRIDEEETDKKRFPLENVQLVRTRLKKLFEKLMEEDAKGLICSAACGADLIALDIAQELGLRRRIVLSSDPEIFRRTSVIDRPGNWGELFDEIYRKLNGSGNVIVVKSEKNNDELYLKTNKRILDEAASFSDQIGYESISDDFKNEYSNKIVSVIVWEGTSRGTNDITEDFINVSHARNIEVVEVLTK